MGYGSSKKSVYFDNFYMDTDIDFFSYHYAIQHLVVLVLYSKQLKFHIIPRSKFSSTQLVDNWLANWQSLLFMI